jgi:hypothetical protein
MIQNKRLAALIATAVFLVVALSGCTINLPAQTSDTSEEQPSDTIEQVEPVGPSIGVTVEAANCDPVVEECSVVVTLSNSGSEPVGGIFTALLIGPGGKYASSDTSSGSGAFSTTFNPGVSEYGIYGFNVSYGDSFTEIQIIMDGTPVGSAAVCTTAAYNDEGNTSFC